MKKINIIIFSSFIFISCGTSRILTSSDLAIRAPIKASLLLSNIKDDRIPVEINPGRFKSDSIIYRLPKVVQGTYEISNFGSYVSNFNAYDYKGINLPAKSLDENSWIIYSGKKLDRITYEVEDTFDIENTDRKTPFSPAGTNIEKDNFMLNLHGFIGYFDLLKNNPYELKITANKEFIRSSAIPKVSEYYDEYNNITTSYYADRYFEITDNPMMYGELDVEEFMVGDIKIVLSVYSPKKKHSANSLKETVEVMMKAQKKYLGSINTTSRYDIFLYLSDLSENAPSGLGALEHHTSTVVVLSEDSSRESLAKSIIDVVAHEFFHIVTPLSVHSEDIHFFDYNSPTFSKHLWMYEGVTEYFAQHFQINQGLIDKNEFYDVIMGKIRSASRYDDSMSFSKMSENILEEPYAANYYNVYQKGALIAMCIDILLRKESNGLKGILTLMKELSKKYGKVKPFNDDLLFNEIELITYPSIGLFIKNHIQGNIPINYNDFFDFLDLELRMDNVETTFIQANGQLIFRADKESENIYFNSNVLNNSFWLNQGVNENDLFKSFKGEIVSLKNINFILNQMFEWDEGQSIDLIIESNGKEKNINTKLVKTYMKAERIFEIPDSSKFKKEIRESWLYK